MTYAELGKTCAEIAGLVSMLGSCGKGEKAMADNIKRDIAQRLAKLDARLESLASRV